MRRSRSISLLLPLLCATTLAAPLAAADPQPYDKVVTKDAKTSRGALIVHQFPERCLYEIPPSELDREFLLSVRVVQAPPGVGFNGFLTADRIIRFHLSGQRVLLYDVNYTATADPRTPLAAAVKAANTNTILMAFDVAALSPDGAPVIDVTHLFTTDVAAFNLRTRLGASHLDGARTWLDHVAVYPQNLEAEATQTWTRVDQTIVAGLMKPGDATIQVHYSMIRLPEKPMLPRLYDNRVGLFQAGLVDYGSDEQRAKVKAIIVRWRLEKKDPAAAISDPVKPIVYYLDPAIPERWRAFVRKGVEEWLPALEAAGFRNALQVRDAPAPAEDPAFSIGDIRYSVIRWLPTTTQNAFGPNVHDPRTGEILNADIEFHHNMLNLARVWCFTQTAPLDPGASKLPLSDETMGRAIQMLIAHETGHSLGMEHNLKASSLYPHEKVRDKQWVATMGFTPSVMDYVRFNYVAQPEDDMPVDLLPAHVGPYDRWAIHWAYAPIPEAATPENEKPTLDQWTRDQDQTPWLRYTTLVGWGADTGDLAEAVGDQDAIASTTLGHNNLQRLMKMLVPATTAKPGEPMDDLLEMYTALIAQWSTELHHVIAIVGGTTSQSKNAGQAGRVFTPISGARQKQAALFLNQNAFQTPTWLIDPEVVRRIEPAGSLNRIRDAQTGVLNSLMGTNRFTRITEHEAIDGNAAWSPTEFLATLRSGIWLELSQPKVKIDPYRRNLQRGYLDASTAKLNGPNTDEKALYRAELKTLDSELTTALPKSTDKPTTAHIEAAKAQIQKALSLKP